MHNGWHLALFHFGLEEIDEVLALVDERILGGQSAVAAEKAGERALARALRNERAARL